MAARACSPAWSAVPAPSCGCCRACGLRETLSDALLARRDLADDESVITRTGEWIGRDWLRVNRGGDPHSGVLEREQRVKQLRVELARSEENTREMETLLATCRSRSRHGGTGT